ncbi:MAG: hypothetical protein DRP62_08350 [Planctomycetota bacterium]|nr:MAG: hypothetical protein DRP62_08350 [Planctomycetota bacterium]
MLDKQNVKDGKDKSVELSLSFFACPNPDCADFNTSYMERLNGTIRGQQARLIRRTRSGSHRQELLQYSIWLWRDLYNWTRVHYSLLDETPALALSLTNEVWTVLKYILHPVHVSYLQRMFQL